MNPYLWQETDEARKAGGYAGKDISGGSVADGWLAATTGECLSLRSKRVKLESERISRLTDAGTGASLAAYPPA